MRRYKVIIIYEHNPFGSLDPSTSNLVDVKKLSGQSFTITLQVNVGFNPERHGAHLAAETMRLCS